MNIIYKNLKDLKPYEKNAKRHDKRQIERIAESIKEFGFTQPVLIDKNNTVVAGHGRILGAKKAGLTEVPTVCMEELTEEQIKAYRLVDNKLNESLWDNKILDEELTEILTSDIDMVLFGFDVDLSDEELNNSIRNITFQAKKKFLVIISCESEQHVKHVQKEIEQLGYSCDIKIT